VFKHLRRLKYRVSEAWGFARYQKPHRFAVRIVSKIHNTTKQNVSVFVVLPIPGDTEAQRVHEEPTFSPNPEIIGSDERYGNGYAAWNIELRAGTVTELREYFIVRAVPQEGGVGRSSMEAYEGVPSSMKDAYLRPTPFTDSSDERVIAIAERVKKNETDPFRIARALNAYVVRHLDYGDPINGLYRSSEALERPRVDCGGFAALFVALSKAAGIPARIVSGCWAGSKKGGMHAWAEWMHPSGVWVPVDPATETLARAVRTKKSGHFGFIGSDRITLSHGDSIPIRHAGGIVTADILQHPAVFVNNEPAIRHGIATETQFIIPKIWRA
jgi:transglutaminase-like putative cysteine protease